MAEVRKGFYRKWEDEVDPERALPEAERRRRADAAMRLHMARMAFISARVRSKSADRAVTELDVTAVEPPKPRKKAGR